MKKWLKNYQKVKEYMEINKRNPSKYDLDIRHLYTWLKHQRKVMNTSGMKPDRVEKYERLLELTEKYRRVNQYL